MSRITSGTTGLGRAYAAHLAAATQDCPSHHLLIFYAAECGLKSVQLRRKVMVEDKKTAQQSLKDSGHNLLELVKELRLPKSQTLATLTFRTAAGDGPYNVDRLHEAWRYGTTVNSSDQKVIIAWLREVCTWVKGNL